MAKQEIEKSVKNEVANVENQETQMMEVSTENKNEVAMFDGETLLDGTNIGFYCSIPDNGSRADKVKIYNAINSCEHSLHEFYNKELEITDVACHPVQLLNKETGEIVDTYRTILLDKNGVGYQAVSQGVISSLQKIFKIVGRPTWQDEPVTIIPTQVKTSNKFNVTVLVLK